MKERKEGLAHHIKYCLCHIPKYWAEFSFPVYSERAELQQERSRKIGGERLNLLIFHMGIFTASSVAFCFPCCLLKSS